MRVGMDSSIRRNVFPNFGNYITPGATYGSEMDGVTT